MTKKIFYFVFSFYFLNSISAQTNLVVNGDFENGNTGFTSTLSYFANKNSKGGEYTIHTDANKVHWGWEGFDHTSGKGKYMIINGDTFSMWEQRINVKKNTYYCYSAWFKNIAILPTYANEPWAIVELRVNGKTASDSMTLVDYPNKWKQIDTVWFSGDNTVAYLSIVNYQHDPYRNDFAVDDIFFAECGSEQGTGIKEYNQINIAEIFPNPSNGNVYIKLFSSEKNISLTLISSTGEMIERKSIAIKNDEENILQLNNLESGIYFVNFISGNYSIIKKIIKLQ